MAARVSRTFPPSMWFSQRKIGAAAAKVPQLVPVAMERIAETIRATTATD